MLGMFIWRAAVLGACAMLVAGCGRNEGGAAAPSGIGAISKAPVDVQAAFDAQYGRDELSHVLNLRRAIDVATKGGPASAMADACIVQGMIASGSLTISPYAEREPYFGVQHNFRRGAFDDVYVSLGRRKVTGVSNPQRWKEDPAQYYAVTVNYVISGSNDVGGKYAFGPFSARLVFANHPAVGEWRLVSGPPDGAIEKRTALSQLDAACDLTTVNAKVQAAVDEARNIQESQLGESLGVARTDDPSVIYSSSTNLYYHLARGLEFNESNAQRAIGMASSRCNQVTARGLRTWRLAGADEVRPLVKQMFFIDTSDRRIWKSSISIPDGNYLLGITSDNIGVNGAIAYRIQNNGEARQLRHWGAQARIWTPFCVAAAG